MRIYLSILIKHTFIKYIINKVEKMTIHFRGGEYLQKGRGIGGFFRGLVNFFRPMMKSAGSSIVKAATSNTAKSIAKTLGEQAMDSSLNMAKDMIHGNDLRDSLNREIDNFKQTGDDIVTDLKEKIGKKRKPPKRMNKATKRRKVTLGTMRKYESRPY